MGGFDVLAHPSKDDGLLAKCPLNSKFDANIESSGHIV